MNINKASKVAITQEQLVIREQEFICVSSVYKSLAENDAKFAFVITIHTQV